MKILVTGGRGFIGKRLVEKLIQKKIRVDVLSRSEPKDVTQKNGLVNIIRCDLLNPRFDFDDLVGKYDVIFNCAGELHNESLMYPLHVEATKRLIDACKKVAQKQNRSIHWIQLSSVGAYGSNQLKANAERVVTEEITPVPIGEYEVTKTLADKLIIDAADKFFSYSILRPSNVYGTEMPNNSIRQLAAMIKKGLFFYIGKPGAISNYVHVDDVVDALVLCGFDPHAKNEVFNISNDCGQDVVINALARSLGVAEPCRHVNELLARLVSFLFSWLKGFPLTKSRIDALVSRTKYSNEKLTCLLDFTPSRDVAKTIGEVVSVEKGIKRGK